MLERTFGAGVPDQSIPQQRIIAKLDEYMAHRDYDGAERHLLYWLDEAKALGDKRGELMVRNELIGHFRKVSDKQRALEQIDAALGMLGNLGMENTISAGTTYTNAATACNAFGENERALELFEQAAKLYEGSDHTGRRLLGGLYNNMALACVSLGRYDEADDLYAKALDAMAEVENGTLEQAITYLNMADALVARTQAAPAEDDDAAWSREAECESRVNELLDKASELLDDPTVPRDGYYAFVCEKCAPVFGHYGYFLVDRDLRERAQEIYERS